MKTCTKCNLRKDHQEFPPNRACSDALSSWCRSCHRAAERAHSLKNRGRYVSRRLANAAHIKRNAEEVRRQRKQFIERLKSGACLDCRKRYPSYCMDFDHVRGQKRIKISSMGNHSVEAILDEIKKCDLVCANCHRIRTAYRRPLSKKFGKFRERLEIYKVKACLDCGLQFSPVVMDFDHVHGEKILPIADMREKAWSQVLLELQKCELVCACCHRVRTRNRALARVFGGWRRIGRAA